MPAGRMLAALAGLFVLASSAAADEIDLFHAAVEEFSSHNRAAIGYLRTDNLDLGAVEIDRMREAWAALSGRFGKPPAAMRDNPLYVTTFVDVPMRLIGALLMLKMSRPDLARDGLVAIRQELSDLRRASHLEVLADCILDANTAMDRLFAGPDGPRGLPPDLSSPEAAAEFAARADAYGTVVRRCDAMAPADVRQHGEFRRLVDGIAASLAQMPQAIAARDGGLVHRLLVELRSFDNLLAFRYG